MSATIVGPVIEDPRGKVNMGGQRELIFSVRQPNFNWRIERGWDRATLDKKRAALLEAGAEEAR